MIIRIEDAPAVKHITIDIDFTGEGEATTTIVKDVKAKKKNVPKDKPRDKLLDLDEDFSHETEDVIDKPVIVDEPREAKVSDDMQHLEI